MSGKRQTYKSVLQLNDPNRFAHSAVGMFEPRGMNSATIKRLHLYEMREGRSRNRLKYLYKNDHLALNDLQIHVRNLEIYE